MLYLILQQCGTGFILEAGIQMVNRLPASLNRLKIELETEFIFCVLGWKPTFLVHQKEEHTAYVLVSISNKQCCCQWARTYVSLKGFWNLLWRKTLGTRKSSFLFTVSRCTYSLTTCSYPSALKSWDKNSERELKKKKDKKIKYYV